MIYNYSGGVPRLGNLVCDNSLLVGYSNDTQLIDSEIINRAISQLLPNFDGQQADVFSSEPIGEQEEVDHGRRL